MKPRSSVLQNERFDVAANFINFTRPQVERDIRLFSGRVGNTFLSVLPSALPKSRMSELPGYGKHAVSQSILAVFADKIACENA